MTIDMTKPITTTTTVVPGDHKRRDTQQMRLKNSRRRKTHNSNSRTLCSPSQNWFHEQHVFRKPFL